MTEIDDAKKFAELHASPSTKKHLDALFDKLDRRGVLLREAAGHLHELADEDICGDCGADCENSKTLEPCGGFETRQAVRVLEDEIEKEVDDESDDVVYCVRRIAEHIRKQPDADAATIEVVDALVEKIKETAA